jgi:hypothetical protein
VRNPLIPEAFRFDDPQQERIYRLLLRIVGPGPAAFFLDACRLMATNPPLGTGSHLVAHCLREVESSLRAVQRLCTETLVMRQDAASTTATPFVRTQGRATRRNGGDLPAVGHSGSVGDRPQHMARWISVSLPTPQRKDGCPTRARAHF